MALEDLLNDNLTEEALRIIVQKQYQIIRENVLTTDQEFARSKTLGKAKSLLEFYELVRQAIEDYEKRAGLTESKKILFTEEEPDVDVQTETVTVSLVHRQPGAFGQGSPLEARVKNMRPRLREEVDDDENPGYKMAISGYWYDNLVRFTCWAKTNKAANARALWFEDLMEEYSWWFKLQGVDRTMFHERQSDIVIDVSGHKWYGRPIDYFVRTERIRVFSMKTIEEIIVKLMTKRE